MKSEYLDASVRARSLVEILQWRARYQPELEAYTFLLDGEKGKRSLTYAELDQQARAVALLLEHYGVREGERALVLFPPGIEYILAFWGCLYAGIIAVPAYPPRQNHHLARIETIAANAEAKIAITTPRVLTSFRQETIQHPALQHLQWVHIDDFVGFAGIDAVNSSRQVPEIGGQTIAFIQYTSGSTGTPKGVILTHDNLLHNSSLIRQSLDPSPISRGVSWLPPYHDLGLIGGVIQPVYSGFPITLMSPTMFLQRPLRWLEAISQFKGTMSGGPNFAYELCARRFSAEPVQHLDLSSWEVAFSGAEPINPETLEHFSSVFSPFGFKKEAFTPCYGLAESTLVVSCTHKAVLPNVRVFDSEKLAQNYVAESSQEQVESGSTRTLVSCGQALSDQEVLIVNPLQQSRAAPDQVGEIWVSGPSVSPGYWNLPDKTEETLCAHLKDTGEGPFLRTGDLGFFFGGELFIAGRLKDLIIIRGRNHYPQDIEATVEKCHQALRPACCAAFSITVAGEERLVIAQEVERQFRFLEPGVLTTAIRQAVAEHHQLQAYAVVLLKSGSMPKTSSGKVQRYMCRMAFLAGTLETVSTDILETISTTVEEGQYSLNLTVEKLLEIEKSEQQALLVAYLRELVTQVMRLPLSQIDITQSLSALGFDSLAITQLKYALETSLEVTFSITNLLGTSIEHLAAQILAEIRMPPLESSSLLIASQEDVAEHQISYSQRALWFLHQLAPESGAYNIANAIGIPVALHIPALQRAFQALIERHTSLSTTFALSAGKPVQRIGKVPVTFFQHEDAEQWDENILRQRLAAEAARPFDLEAGPLLRVYLFSQSPHNHVLLFVVHHIVADFWSLTILIRELIALYQGEETASPVTLEPQLLRYSDYVSWQTTMLAGPEGERLWSYWSRRLEGELPLLNLPIARPRPPLQTYTGATVYKKLDRMLTRRLKDLAAVHEATLYTVLLAAFQVLLYRYTGQEDILVGSPTTGRNQARLADIVGYFVNPVVLRARFSGNPSFKDFLLATKQTVLEAFEHQDYPFALLAERLPQTRDASRSPLFQVMFTLQKAPLVDGVDMAGFALGETRVRITLNGLPLEAVPVAQRTSQFDMTLAMVELDEGLYASLQYNTDLFADQTMQRLLEHFQILLEGIVTSPDKCLHALPLLAQEELQRVLVQWQGTNPFVGRDENSPPVHKQIEARVELASDAIAAIFHNEHLSYDELNRRSNVLAWHLRKLGVGPGSLVGIYVKRSLEMLIGILGILKSGGAYVPLDVTYPQDRLSFMIHDAALAALLTQEPLAEKVKKEGIPIVCFEQLAGEMAGTNPGNLCLEQSLQQLAYVIYTSGSTGMPKGVMIQHHSLINFLSGIDRCYGSPSSVDVLLTVTSISFDISILELLWTLSRGIRVVVLPEQVLSDTSGTTRSSRSHKPIEFSLFYFASDEGGVVTDKYRLLVEGAKFADQHGFAAVWTPERHFHAFGGLYPNPAVTAAALATVTRHLHIRAGSVVMPLHSPIRVAEEWAVVDNLTNGRAGIAFASGWQADDFVFFPENYTVRKEAMFNGIEAVRKLWRGEAVTVPGGAGNVLDIRIFPRPIQAELPIWITAAGSPETFVNAGKIGANILTHLLGQTVEEVAEKIKLYRQARMQHGYNPEDGHVTLMLHTFIGEDKETVRQQVHQPFSNYLKSSVDLIANLIKSLNLPLDLKAMNEQDLDDLVGFAFDRYFESSALFGTPETCRQMIDTLREVGVDEIACLIDFGVDYDSVLESLHLLNRLKESCNDQDRRNDFVLPTQALWQAPTLMQCTPSLMRILAVQDETVDALQSLHTLMLGGEALPPFLARQLTSMLACRLINMYGPTETTIWSATYEVREVGETVPIGGPLLKTQLYILDHYWHLVPPGLPGELYIGGDGLARGYLHRPEMTAERFVPDPFSSIAGSRLYRTGDLVRHLPDGTIEYLGRIDQQVKIRGHRIELEEIEVALAQHALVRDAVVLARGDTFDDRRLVAYIVPHEERFLVAVEQASAVAEIKSYLKEKLPDYMVPSTIVLLSDFPLTPNGKIDRKALPTIQAMRLQSGVPYVEPSGRMEQALAEIWKEVLQVECVGIHDNFFDLGGHSLLIAQVHNQMKQQLHCQIPLAALLEHPTISSLAEYLSQSTDEQPSFQPSQDRARKQIEGLKRQRQQLRRRTGVHD